MKILFFTNQPFPAVSEHFGLRLALSQGWILDIADKIACMDNIELTVASLCETTTCERYEQNRITHYLIPEGSRLSCSKRYDKHITRIIEDTKPDIVHLFGTESVIGLRFLKLYTNATVLLTIQGVMNRISDEYFGGLTVKELIRYRTMREWIRFGGALFAKIRTAKQKRNETWVLSHVKYVTGRTLWDYSVMKSINPNLQYFRCNFNLRAEFYSAAKWDMRDIERHTIFTSYADYPLKGLHYLLRAVAIVKKDYPDVILNVPGVPGDANNHLIVNTGYKKYINKLIDELGITQNVRFLGPLKTNDVIRTLQKTNVTVVPSAIEGASATICESMFIGAPCICSYRGGMTELLKDGTSGFYYDFKEYAYLAERVKQVFSNDDLAKKFSENAICDAQERHDREKNPKSYVDVYQTIITNGGGGIC